jgi:hypothetical protein
MLPGKPMDTPRSPHSYVLSLWQERRLGEPPRWRGEIVTQANQRLRFATLAELNRWLAELAGWQDPPPHPSAPHDGEPP